MWVTVGSGEGKGLSVRVEGERFLIGSGAECQLMLGDPNVEPLHAYLQADGDGRVELHDLGSEGGTYVDGERIAGSRLLHDGDEVRVGDTVLIATLEDPAREAAANQLGSESEPAPAVRVTTDEGEEVEVVPASEHRRRRALRRPGGAEGRRPQWPQDDAARVAEGPQGGRLGGGGRLPGERVPPGQPDEHRRRRVGRAEQLPLPHPRLAHLPEHDPDRR